jgi:hypothetical protein
MGFNSVFKGLNASDKMTTGAETQVLTCSPGSPHLSNRHTPPFQLIVLTIQVLSAPLTLTAQVAVSQIRQVNDDLSLD